MGAGDSGSLCVFWSINSIVHLLILGISLLSGTTKLRRWPCHARANGNANRNPKTTLYHSPRTTINSLETSCLFDRGKTKWGTDARCRQCSIVEELDGSLIR